MKINSVALLAVAWTLFGAVNAHAGTITYLDFPAWSGAVFDQTAVTVPNPSSADGFDDLTAGVNYAGVIFTSDLSVSQGGFFNIGPTANGGNPAVLAAQQLGFEQVNILITLPRPVTAFSLNFDTFDGENVSFLLSNGDSVTLQSTADLFLTSDFFGVTDSNPFSTILVTSGDESLNLNNIGFGSAVSAVPEPSTWVMLLMGFAGIGFLSYRHARRDQIVVI